MANRNAWLGKDKPRLLPLRVTPPHVVAPVTSAATGAGQSMGICWPTQAPSPRQRYPRAARLKPVSCLLKGLRPSLPARTWCPALPAGRSGNAFSVRAPPDAQNLIDAVSLGR